jgi:rhamnose transport system substrate-binding protein
MQRKRFIAIATTAALATVSLAACSSNATGSASSAAATACKTTGLTIGLLPKTGTDPYMTTVRDAVDAAAKADGNKVIYEQPADSNGATQIPFVQDLIAKKVDVIAISGSDQTSTKAALGQAKAAGIKVISFDSDVDTSSRSVFVNQVDTNAIGEALLKSMTSLMGGKGTFAIESSTQTATNQNAWIATIKDKLKTDPAYKDMKLATVVYGNEDKTVSATVAKQLVQTYPDLTGIIIPAGLSYAPAAAALQEVGAFGKVKLTGLTPSTGIKDYLSTGNAEDIWWNVSNLGTLTYNTAKAVAGCTVTGKSGDSIDSGALGKFTVGESGVVLLGPATVVNKDNVDAFPF